MTTRLHTSTPRVPWVVAITGASGIPYATSVLRAMIDAGVSVDLVISRAARLTMLDELGYAVRDGSWQADIEHWLDRDVSDVRYWTSSNFAAGPSSGSYLTHGTIVVPATTAAVMGIALGSSKDLVQRAAEVALKERRRLILVVREMPLRAPVLSQMAELAREGAVIMPASPAFYAGGKNLQQLVDFVAGRVLDQCSVEHDLYRRWQGVLGRSRTDDASVEETGSLEP